MLIEPVSSDMLRSLLIRCEAAHHPHPASSYFAREDVRFALQQAGASVELLDSFDGVSAIKEQP